FVTHCGQGSTTEANYAGKEGPFEEAIREIIENESYKEKTRNLKETLLDRQFSMKEIFVRNMEFVAKHGPLRQLDHYGRHLNFIQYYLIDVIGALIG
ncbi:hypothetical protein PRIPAC_74517, partial [Pristionchus pacificus]